MNITVAESIRPDYDQVIQDIADYLLSDSFTSDEVMSGRWGSLRYGCP